MVKFRYLPQTADMRFRAYGSNFKEAFENAALALLNVMLDLRKIKKDSADESSMQINESAYSKEDLVWFTLQDILSKIDSMKLNAYSFKIKSIKKGRKLTLKGKLSYKRTRNNYAMLSVKAVTPHDLKIEQKKGGFAIQVVVDV